MPSLISESGLGAFIVSLSQWDEKRYWCSVQGVLCDWWRPLRRAVQLLWYVILHDHKNGRLLVLHKYTMDQLMNLHVFRRRTH